MYKFNNGIGAIVCDKCGLILKAPAIQNNEKIFCSSCNLVNNFDLIQDYISFHCENDMYFIQIIQRKKDEATIINKGNQFRSIKSYYITSLEDFIEKKPEIISLCEKNNARAYMYLNRRNTKQLVTKVICEYAKLIELNTENHGYKVWNSVCGKYSSTLYKDTWLIDLDSTSKEYIEKIKEIIMSVRGNANIITEIPTLNGIHLITTHFDTSQFSQKLAILNLDQIAVIKDGPTLLYYNGNKN